MNQLVQALARLDADFQELGIRYALVGGLAVSARSEPRTTRDLDVAISVSNDSEAEGLVVRLRGLGYHSGEFLEQESTGRLMTVRMVTPGGSQTGVVLDLLFASSGIEPEIVANAEQLEILPGIVAPIARLGHLIAVKLLAYRLKDRVDLEELMKVASNDDVALARASLERVTARGFDRSADLDARLHELLGPRSRS